MAAIASLGTVVLNHGKIVAVRGSMVDVESLNHLPAIYTLLYAGKENQIAIEVLSQLNNYRVRGIALTPTAGLARGIDHGRILSR